MIEFLKRFGLGIVYVVISPVLLLILAGFALYGIFVFIFTGINGIISFFKGKSFFAPFPEDEKAQKILNLQNGLDETGHGIIPNFSQPVAPIPNPYVSPSRPVYEEAPTVENQYNSEFQQTHIEQVPTNQETPNSSSQQEGYVPGNKDPFNDGGNSL